MAHGRIRSARSATVTVALLALSCVASACGEPTEASLKRGPDEAPTDPRWARCVARVERKLAYGAAPQQRVDLYLPAHGERPAPLLVWLHPGGWAGGSRDDVHHWALGQACAGFAVAAVDYRLSEEALFPAPLRDVRAAIRLLTARADEDGTDATRVAVWGASAGGHLAALLGVTDGRGTLATTPAPPPVRVRAVVTWWAPVDFARMDAPLAARCPHPSCHACAGSPESRLVGAEIATHPELARRASPLTYTGDGPLPPFLVMHGSADCTVPVEQAELLAARLREAGGSVDLAIVEGASHGSGEWARPSVLARVGRFLQAHVAAAE